MKNEIVQAMNQYLSNSGVLYTKWHHLHWNIVGRDFKPVHEYLETLYDGMAEVLDETAECLKMHQAQPVASLKEFLEMSDIEEMQVARLSTTEALEIVQKDLENMKAKASNIRAMADAEDLYDVVSLMEDHLGDYLKTLWFIESMMK